MSRSCMKIFYDSTLPNINLFKTHFELTAFDHQNLSILNKEMQSQDILICRSTLKVSAELLQGTSIQCVATASSGIDHIDVHYLSQQGIQLFDAKGSNAESVDDYINATLAWLSKHNKIQGNKAGVVGVGKVGTRISASLKNWGFSVLSYDPPKASRVPDFDSCSLEEIISCDLISIHADLNDLPNYPSRNLINQHVLTQLKPNTILINAARGGIVNETALCQQKNIIYCTDVYDHEPSINAQIVNFATLCTPHIAGHSLEAKSQAVVDLAKIIHRYFNLPEPNPLPALPHHFITPQSHGEPFEDYILRLYDPSIETAALKAASDKKNAFLTLRQAHQFRHHFSTLMD